MRLLRKTIKDNSNYFKLYSWKEQGVLIIKTTDNIAARMHYSAQMLCGNMVVFIRNHICLYNGNQ